MRIVLEGAAAEAVHNLTSADTSLPEVIKGLLSNQARIEKALDFAGRYGDIDGSHHKMWVIDQMVRALTGCPTVQKQVVDCHGKLYTYDAQGESDEYYQFLDKGPWDEGIAP